MAGFYNPKGQKDLDRKFVVDHFRHLIKKSEEAKTPEQKKEAYEAWVRTPVMHKEYKEAKKLHKEGAHWYDKPSDDHLPYEGYRAHREHEARAAMDEGKKYGE